MGKTSKNAASRVESMPGFEGRYEEVDGYTIGYEAYSMDADLAPFFKGLPDDRCQCPHWGTVTKGKLVYTYDDGSKDVIASGEAYYARPGHTPEIFAGTEVVEFSPSVQLGQTMEVVLKNVEMMG